MPTRAFTQTFDVTASPAEVRAFLLDPTSIPRIHPLIPSVTVTGERQEGGARVVSFTAEEEVPIGPFTLHNHLRCEAWDDPAAPPRAVARAALGVVVDSTYTIEALPVGCRVTQALTLTAAWGTMAFVFRTAVAAHTRQAAAIQAYFLEVS